MWAQWSRGGLPCSAASRATTGAQMARSPISGRSHAGRQFGRKRQHVGGVVLAAVVAVERAAFVGIHDADRQLGRLAASGAVQRRLDPAAKADGGGQAGARQA